MLDHEDVDQAPEEIYRAGAGNRLADRQTPVPKRVLRRVTADDFDDEPDGGFLRTQTRIRVRRGVVPQSVWGKVLAGTALFVMLSAVVAGLLVVRNFLLHDPRFLIESSSDIQIDGNSHVSRPQLLSIFGEDIGRNLFYVPLSARRAQLETLPWVEHATVMRLLPDRLRVSVVERTPVAFVRQDGHIGLVDANGVLLDLPADDPAGAKYSFPVLTGISAADPLSTRAARMKIYRQFMQELDASGARLTDSLSEVDVSNPEDVKALIPDHSSEILVHFGDEDFLERFQRYQQQLPAWRAQYPNLASVDMRYASQVVLDMSPGTDGAATVPDANAAANAAAPNTAGATVSVPAESVPPAPKDDGKSGKKSAAVPMAPVPAAKASAPVVAKPVAVKTPAPLVAAKMPAATMPVATKPMAKTPAAKPAAVPVAASATPAPKQLKLAPTAVPVAKATPVPAPLPNLQSSTPPQYSTQHPLTQPFDVSMKKPAAKAKPVKAKSAGKAKRVVVKSKAKAAAPVKPAPNQTD